jgi:hypothetical protein
MTLPAHVSCTDPHCSLPVAKIINGALVIESRHYGKKHQGVISLEWLRDQLEQATETKSLTNSDKTVIRCAATALSPSG